MREPLTLARGSSVSLIVGVPAGVTAKSTSAAVLPRRRIVAFPVTVDRPAPFARPALRRRSLRLDRRDRALDPRLDHGGVAAHDERGILERRQGLGLRGLEVDDKRRASRIGRRINPSVDAAFRGSGGSVAAAPVEGGGEPAVDLGPGRGGRGEGQQRHAEAQGIRVAVDHARRGPRKTNRLERTFEARSMLGPKRPGQRVVVISERIGEGSRRLVGFARVAVESGLDVAGRGPA